MLTPPPGGFLMHVHAHMRVHIVHVLHGCRGCRASVAAVADLSRLSRSGRGATQSVAVCRGSGRDCRAHCRGAATCT